MDRSLRGGTGGLTSAWLRVAKDMDFEQHQLYKDILSGEDSHAQRSDERRFLEQRSENDAQIKQWLELEKEARDGESDETRCIACKASFARMTAAEPAGDK